MDQAIVGIVGAVVLGILKAWDYRAARRKGYSTKESLRPFASLSTRPPRFQRFEFVDRGKPRHHSDEEDKGQRPTWPPREPRNPRF